MNFLIGLFLGILCGAGVTLFIHGATKNEREHHIYMEGFNDGQAAPRYTKADFPLPEKE